MRRTGFRHSLALSLPGTAGCWRQRAQQKHFSGMEESSDSSADAGSLCVRMCRLSSSLSIWCFCSPSFLPWSHHGADRALLTGSEDTEGRETMPSLHRGEQLDSGAQ